jgi:Tfp pilus assembly protein PilZ
MTEAERSTREHPRYEVSAYVDYTGGSELLLYHQIQNISLGGICISSPSTEEVGTLVDLVINFPDLGKSMSLRGMVVWANREPPQDMGIRYVDLDEGRRETLKQYIDRVKRP